MAILSYTKQFCFIHIPKTAGKSIGTRLAPYEEQAASHPFNRLLSSFGIRVNHYGPHRIRRFRVHATAETIRRHLPAGIYDSLWSFCFVRNPWDMLVSQYEFIRQSPNNKRYHLVRGMEFADFVQAWLGKAGGQGRQKRYVTDASGRRLVDFVGRYESLGQDFRQIAKRIGIASDLPQIGRSFRRDYRAYYSDDLAAFVAEQLAEDVDYFGYSFDDFARGSNLVRRAA